MRKKTTILPVDEEAEDLALLKLAAERLAHFDPNTLISEEDVWRKFPMSSEELAAVEPIEFE